MVWVKNQKYKSCDDKPNVSAELQHWRLSVGLPLEPSAPSRGGASQPQDPIATYGAEEERQDVRLWRTVIIGEQEHRINMKIIEPYMRVISHGGADAASDGPLWENSCKTGPKTHKRNEGNRLLRRAFIPQATMATK